MSQDKFVECAIHGSVKPAFVCQHLVGKPSKLGFYESELGADDPNYHPDFESQGWCQQCENVRASQKGWDDISEAFANPTLVCEFCFQEIKKANQL